MFSCKYWFPRETTSEKRAQKFYTDDASLPRSWYCFWLAENLLQPQSEDLGSDTSSVWSFCARFLDFISWRNQWSRREMSVVFSGYFIWNPLLLSCFTIHVPAIHLHFRHHAELLRNSLILIMQIVPFTPKLKRFLKWCCWTPLKTLFILKAFDLVLSTRI